jgi:hypothetical protein
MVWGDATCDESVNPIDSLAVLRHDAGLPVNQEPGCPGLGDTVNVNGTDRLFGDVNCDASVDPVDSLALLRADAGLSVNQEPGCPAPGEVAQVA